jgi:hypothetical protein
MYSEVVATPNASHAAERGRLIDRNLDEAGMLSAYLVGLALVFAAGTRSESLGTWRSGSSCWGAAYLNGLQMRRIIGQQRWPLPLLSGSCTAPSPLCFFRRRSARAQRLRFCCLAATR